MHASGGSHQSNPLGIYSVTPYATSRLKTLVEWCLALLLLIACLPPLAICAVLVLWRDGRPILFQQTRVGQGGRPFRILKFRTMRLAPGLVITANNDSRITGNGRLLRRWKFDELPQLWNIIKGDMSLVGPRPEVPEFVDAQSPEWMTVLSVRPGLTGIAALQCSNEAELLAEAADPLALYREALLPAKLSLELAYLRNCSLYGDLRLLWKTGASFSQRTPETKARSR